MFGPILNLQEHDTILKRYSVVGENIDNLEILPPEDHSEELYRYLLSRVSQGLTHTVEGRTHTIKDLLKLCNNPSHAFIDACVSIDPSLIKIVSNPSRSMITACLAKDPDLIKDIKKPASQDWITAIMTKPSLVKLHPKPVPDGIIEFAIWKNRYFTTMLSNPTLEEQLALVSKKFTYIDEEGNLQNAAEDYWIYPIKDLKDPPEEVQMASLESSGGSSFKYIKNPSREVITRALELRQDNCRFLPNGEYISPVDASVG